jgi:hypothetical protein
MVPDGEPGRKIWGKKIRVMAGSNFSAPDFSAWDRCCRRAIRGNPYYYSPIPAGTWRVYAEAAQICVIRVIRGFLWLRLRRAKSSVVKLAVYPATEALRFFDFLPQLFRTAKSSNRVSVGKSMGGHGRCGRARSTLLRSKSGSCAQ